MRSLLKHPSAVRYAARRVVAWRQHESAVVLELEGVREPDATGIAAVLAGAPLDDALETATLTLSVLESGPVRLRLDARRPSDRASEPTDAGLLAPEELETAPISVTNAASVDSEDPDSAVESGPLRIASERHGGFGPDPEDVAIEVSLDPFGLLVKDAGGRVVAHLATIQVGETESEYRTAPFAWLRWTDATGAPAHATTISLTLAPDERLSGLGERDGPLNLTGSTQTVPPLTADAGLTRPPLLLSSGGYGLLVHTGAGLTVDLGAESDAASTLATPTPTLDVLILPGAWPRTALSAYSRLTGRVDAPEPDRFAVCAAPAADAAAPGAAPATTDAMQATLRRALSAGLAVPGFWHAPLPITPYAAGQGPTPLDVRWAQAALLCPLVGSDAAPETTAHLLDAPAVRPYVALRRRLLPYLLHCARETAQSGLPMLRPLLLEFSWDAEASAAEDQFLLGRDLLVAPIVSAAAQATTRRVHLPRYANWYDFWTGAFIEGGQTVTVTAPLSRLPLYARAGTVIPLGPADASDADDSAPNDADAQPGDPTRLLLFAPHDGAIGASIELADDGLMGVEQERGERKARVFLEGIPRTVRDIQIVGLPTGATLVDASSPAIAIVPSDDSLPGLGEGWHSLTIRLDTGAFTAGLELSW